jgi:hypothetical protein
MIIKPFLTSNIKKDSTKFITNRWSIPTKISKFSEWPIRDIRITKALENQDSINNLKFNILSSNLYKAPDIIWTKNYYFPNNLVQLKQRIDGSCKTDDILFDIMLQLENNDEISIEVSNNELPFVAGLISVSLVNKRQNIIFIRKECP